MMASPIEPDLLHVPRLYGCPKLFPDEAPSSWIYRIGAHYYQPHDEIVDLLFGANIYPHYLDTRFSQLDIGLLAHVTLNDESAIASAFKFGKSRLCEDEYFFVAHNRYGNPIYKVCAHCLEEDEIPYFRLHWRLAFMLLCEKHNAALTRFCAACHTRICPAIRNYTITRRGLRRCADPIDKEFRKNVLRYCQDCRATLPRPKINSPPRHLSHLVMKFQRDALNAVATGYHFEDYFSPIDRIFIKDNGVRWRNFLGDQNHGALCEWYREMQLI